MNKCIFKLNDICDISGGYAFKSTIFKDNGIPIIRIGDISDNKINISETTVYINENIEKYKNFIISKGDILIALSGATTGKFGIYNYDEPSLLNQRVAKLFPKKDVLNKYLYHYMNKLQDTIYNKALGCAQPNISPKEIGELEIYLPNINEQKAIVEVLDKAQELIDKRKKQIEALDELVKSKFIEMFGDPFNDEKGFGTNKLGEVTGVNPKKAEIKDLDKELLVSFVPMDRVGEKGEFNPEVSKSIGEVYSGFTYFRENDVLFAKITPCMENGKGAVAVNLSNGIGFGSTEFHVLRPLREKSNSYWIYHLTTLIEFRRLAERKMTGSAGQKRVPTDFLNNIQVVVPPIELQNQFADFVKKTDKLKFEMEKSLKELEDNFNSLMQKAFKGELFN